ncbi:transposon Ty3-G Gag-Pol polyprotein [Gossypium australe]|uniref:Transposon Ty3-G Gag-Pol polyprotein n=1 Tax=Gossypium australe TaxID=47621 RepID=A0A5B6WQ76_9ROSI|nr:transposon Ty3-G Gag-Pol polyprotein [Gossypium australe]
MASQLHAISAQLGILASTLRGGDVTVGSSAVRGKVKVLSNSDDVFPFAAKPVQVELPLFTGKDPEEWLALAHDFFEFYCTEDHHHDLVLRTHNLSDEFLTDCFISGLRADIKIDVLSHRPSSMIEVQALTRFQEARLHNQRQLGRASSNKLPPLLPTPNLVVIEPKFQSGHPPPVDQPNPAISTILTPRRVSSAEAQAHREKGLCYYCDAKYMPGHKYKDPQLFLLDDEGTSIVSSQPPQLLVASDGDDIDKSGQDQSLVSLNALAGGIHPNTIRVMGNIFGHQVRILIEGGSTHNFIQSRVTKHLGLSITSTPNFRVIVGNSQKLQNDGCIKDLCLRVQGTEIVTNFYVLPLEGIELVLGVAWLNALGPITMDFFKLSFQF